MASHEYCSHHVIVCVMGLGLIMSSCPRPTPVTEIPSCVDCNDVYGDFDRAFVEEVCFPSKRPPSDKDKVVVYAYSRAEDTLEEAERSAREKINRQIRDTFPTWTVQYTSRVMKHTHVTCSRTLRVQVFARAVVPRDWRQVFEGSGSSE